jgi:hypothetical protein
LAHRSETTVKVRRRLLTPARAWLLLIAGIAAALYLIPSNPCGLPVHYSIGAIDPRFGIAQGDAIASTEVAKAMWEKRIGKDLFVYDELSDFKIDFIFDGRQQAIIDRRALDRRVARAKATDQMMQTAAKDAATRLQDLKEQYESLLADFESRAARHNEAVNYWNARGGAPPPVFDEISQETTALRLEAEQIEALRKQGNQEVDGLNAFVESDKTLASSVNDAIAAFNEKQKSLSDKQAEYTQEVIGGQQKRAIHVYEFSDNGDLVMALAHEFGHALGIHKHEDDPESVMTAVNNTRKDRVITNASVAAVKSACGL